MPVADPFATWRVLQAASNDRTTRLDEATDLAFWETVAEHYDEQALVHRVPAVLERVLGAIGSGKHVLDLGCGTGSFALPIAAAGNWVTGLDYSPAMLRVFQRKLPAASNVQLVHGRIEEADFPPHDIVLAANALYRIADIAPVIARLAALATERVIVVWSVGRAPAWKEEARRRIRPGRYQPGVDYIHLAAALWAAGFHPSIDFVVVPVEERYRDLDAAAQALIDWADPDPEEIAAARAAACDLFTPHHDSLIRETAAAIAIVSWEPRR